MMKKQLILALALVAWVATLGCGDSKGTDLGPKDVITEDPGPLPTDMGPLPTDEGPLPGDEGPLPTDNGPQPNDVVGPTHGIQYAYMPIHMEPGNQPVDPVTGTINFDRPKTYFKDMVKVVEAADVYGHHLTLMFNPQWAAYIVDPSCELPLDDSPGPEYAYQGTDHSDCLSLIRAMELQGHELALHHHPLTAPSTWDGFTSAESWTADRDGLPGEETYYSDGSGPAGADPYHLGDLDDLMAWLDQLPAAGPGHILTATTEEYPGSVRFSAAGGYVGYMNAQNPGDLVSRPCATDFDGHWVWQLRMRLFTSDVLQNKVMVQELPKAMTDFAQASDGPYVVAFVAHARNVFQTGVQPYSDLFAKLDELGLRLERAQDVMAHYTETAGDPADAAPELMCE